MDVIIVYYDFYKNMHIAYILFIFFLFLLSLPLQLIIALLLVILSGWPILFFQKRVGKDGKIFIMYKFRTMNVGSEEQQKKLQKLNEADGPAFKIHDDPRFTKIGKFLAHTALDELPQLINVIKGEMSFVGPRPLPVEEAKKVPKKYEKETTETIKKASAQELKRYRYINLDKVKSHLK